jgi:hypothetical protein
MEKKEYMTPKEKAEDLTWFYYHKIEHMLNDEYSHFDWNIAVSLAKDTVNEIIQFMQDYDELEDSCHFTNHKKWSIYWPEVKKELDLLIINKK